MADKVINNIKLPNGEIYRIGGASGFELFDTALKDHILTYEQTKGWALQGTYVYKEAVAGSRYGYPDFYNKCVEEKDLGVATETVLGENTITLYVNANGHTFYDIADKEAIDTWYSTYGIAWHYGVDTENERIFLPRTKWLIQPSGETTEVNTVNEAGLPNITGGISAYDYNNGNPTGAFNTEYRNSSNTIGGGNTIGKWLQYNFNASQSNPIYGNSTTVQPPSINHLLYICVGNVTADVSHIDIVTQVENGVKDIDDAVNNGVSRLNSIDSLKYYNITNCLLEVPQRVKYTLQDGTLTIHSGTVCIIPYGTEDLTADYPVGSTFLNDNFKVVDTQYMYPQTPSVNGTESKFFVWVEVQNDLKNRYYSQTRNNTIFVDITNNIITLALSSYVSSGSTDTETHTWRFWYNTTNNLVKKFESDATTPIDRVQSFPIMIVDSTVDVGYTSVNQTFNGLGYIGSTVWVDKGVKGLIPNGRNEDGTLRNIERTTPNIITRTLTNQSNTIYVGSNQGNALGLYGKYTYSYDEVNNLNKDNGVPIGVVIIAEIDATNGIISRFTPKQPVNLATIDMVDGQWVPVNYQIVSDTALGANASATYDLSSFLPKDGHIYEVLFSLQAITGSTSGYDVNLSLGTDITPNFIVARGITRASDYVSCVGTPTVPVGNARRITIKQWSSNPCRIVSLTAVCYRRVGISL